MNPSFVWWLSCQAYQHQWVYIARFLKTINFVLFHTVLPYRAEIQQDVNLKHYGIGIVIHPNVSIGYRVTIHQNVTLAAETWIGSPHRIVIEDDVMIGAGAVVIGHGDRTLTIRKGAKVGANAVVTHDVLPNTTVVGVPARPLLPK